MAGRTRSNDKRRYGQVYSQSDPARSPIERLYVSEPELRKHLLERAQEEEKKSMEERGAVTLSQHLKESGKTIEDVYQEDEALKKLMKKSIDEAQKNLEDSMTVTLPDGTRKLLEFPLQEGSDEYNAMVAQR